MGTNDTPPDELPLTSMSANGNSSTIVPGGGGGGHPNAAGKSSNETQAAAVSHDTEECERLKPANGDHTAYGAAPNEVNHHHGHGPQHQHKPCDHSSPLMDNSSNGSAPTSAGGSARFAGTKRHSVMLTRGDTDLSIDHGGFQRFLPKFMHFTFADHEAENLYHEYYSNEKRSDFQALILIVILVNVVILLLHILACVCGKTAPNLGSSASIRHLSILGACLATVLLLCVLCLRRATDGIASRLWSVIPFVLWGVMLVQVVCDLWTYSGGVGPPEAGGGSMVWLLLYTYSTYVIFPLRFRHLSALSWAMAALYLLEVVVSVSVKSYKFINQILANILLIICVNVLSMMSFFFYERQQRRAFLEARQSLEAKIILEEESEEQERLLLSVLPKHVAVEIRKDLGAVVEGQFHKIYMSRHENVSILFADIVGFTAFSSTVSAPELVKTLNELFARFDKLSEKYHQLRIKILGDCYYCISGAPQERPDHAVLCVHMGLSMVEAIKSVREQTKSGVDMRVGVHTGGVLAGVLGQRQWQFDVYSRDVEFANKMESGGLPGRVHISERTLGFLNGEFEVTDGDGASREEAIRLSGVKTYLIVKVIKPPAPSKQTPDTVMVEPVNYPEGTLDANVSDAANGGANANAPGTEDNETTKLAPRESSKPEPSQVTSEDIKDPAVYKERLHGELIHRDSQQVLGTHTHPLTLSFRDDALEASYRDCRDVTSVVGLCGLPLTLATVFLCYFLVCPLTAHLTLTFLLSALLLTLCAFILTVPVASSSVPKPFVMLSSAVQEKSWIRLIIAGTMLAIWVAVIVLLNCFYGDEHSAVHQQQLREGIPSTAQPALAVGSRLSVTTFANSPTLANTSVALPQYLLFFVLLCLVAITALTRISYLVKIGLVSGLVSGQAALLYLRLTASFRLYSSFNGLISNLDIRHYYLAILLTVLVALVIIIRQFELMSRRLFLWQREVVEQREKVSDIRRKNEALVYNILPPHVAVHFLGKRKSDEELYSKSYECIAVLFASMPNFSDFYTEESVNNQGLECIRFLNEVISDYDQLLSQPRFKDIFKIKTISSTYMAAAGLNEEVVQIAENATDVKSKWHHLAQLTEFALTLKETLNFINKESFNNFVLRMGINQGPITAGVIGARKPHYDIWGNTVNVASRMESTGKAGCIQVIEETANILEQFGYVFEQRGLVSVKGKGKLMTYFLVGKEITILAVVALLLLSLLSTLLITISTVIVAKRNRFTFFTAVYRSLLFSLSCVPPLRFNQPTHAMMQYEMVERFPAKDHSKRVRSKSGFSVGIPTSANEKRMILEDKRMKQRYKTEFKMWCATAFGFFLFFVWIYILHSGDLSNRYGLNQYVNIFFVFIGSVGSFFLVGQYLSCLCK